MAGSLMQILTGAGLAGASGHRAFLPPLILGVAHQWAAATAAAGQTPFFELSKQFEWLASPAVIAILAVLTIVEFLRKLMERQAIRRMEQKTLTPKEVEAVGVALMRLEETVRDIGARFGLSPEDLNLDLGPLGKLM